MKTLLHPDVCPPHHILPPGKSLKERLQKVPSKNVLSCENTRDYLSRNKQWNSLMLSGLLYCIFNTYCKYFMNVSEHKNSLNIQISQSRYYHVSLWIIIFLPWWYYLTKSLHLIEAVVSPVAFPEPSANRQLSHAPGEEVVTSGDFSSEFSPPHSPQLKSTARDQSRYHMPWLWQG